MTDDLQPFVAHGSILDFPWQLMDSVHLLSWCAKQFLEVVSDDVTPVAAVALPI